MHRSDAKALPKEHSASEIAQSSVDKQCVADWHWESSNGLNRPGTSPLTVDEGFIPVESWRDCSSKWGFVPRGTSGIAKLENCSTWNTRS